MREDGLAEEELVARLWRLAPVGSKLLVTPLWTWVLTPGVPLGWRVELFANWALPGRLRKLRAEDLVRELGRLAYDDEDAFQVGVRP